MQTSKTTTTPTTPIKPILIILAISFAGYLLSYLSTVLLTRMLGGVGYSAYVSTVSIISMLAISLLLGVDQGLNKYIPQYFSQNNSSAIAAYHHYSRERTWIQFTVIFVIGLLGLILVRRLINYHILPDNDNSVIYTFLWAVPLYAVMWYFGNLTQAGGNDKSAIVILFAAQPFGLVLILGSCWLLHVQVHMIEATFFYVGVTILAGIAGIWVSYQKKLLPKDDGKFPEIKAKWSKATIDLFLLLLVSLCSAFLIIILAQIFAKNPRAAGVLGVLTIICNIFNPVSNGVYALYSPKISDAVATLNSAAIRNLLIKSIVASFIPAVIGFLIIIFYGKVWLNHFGKEYVDYYLALTLMATTVFTNTLLTPFLWLAQFSKDLAGITRIAVVFFILFVVISIPLDHFFDVIGAILGFAFLQLGYWIYLMVVVIKNWRNLYAAPTSNPVNRT